MYTLDEIRTESAKYPRDYMGYWPGTEGYIATRIGQSRDSDNLAKSNYATALKILTDVAATLDPDAEPDDGYVLEHRASHWGPGWVETLWVADVPELTHALMEIQYALESYPVLDDDDYYAREHEEWQETVSDALRYATRDVDTPHDEAALEAAVFAMAGETSCSPDDVSFQAIGEFVQDWLYEAIWEAAHREHLALYPPISPGQLPLLEG